MMQTRSDNHLAGIVTQPRPHMVTRERTVPASRNFSRPKPVALKPSAHRAGQPGLSLVAALTHSMVYREYVRAFTEATGLAVALRPVESWRLPLHGQRHESPFCALMSEKSHTCAFCLRLQGKLAQGAISEPLTMVCEAGLYQTAVPVRVGSRLIGFLQTGQVFRHKPTPGQFDRTDKLLAKLGAKVGLGQMKNAYFATRVMPQRHQAAATTLLRIFAQHLAILGNQVIVQRQHAEPPMIAKAKAYIQEHQAKNLSLEQVALAVNMSKFHFCKLFKRVTGIAFTNYVARLRLEKAKNLLLNPNLRISEIAFGAGFQSLTHCNRIFKKFLGESPTGYRSHLMPALRS